MIKCIAVKQWHDQYGKSMGYTLKDEKGQLMDVPTEKIKEAMLNNLVSIENLRITSDNKLITKEISFKDAMPKVNVKLEHYPYDKNNNMLVIFYDNQKAWFMPTYEYNKILQFLNTNKNLNYKYENASLSFEDIVSKYNIPNYREEYLEKFCNSIIDNIKYTLEFLVLDDNKPYKSVVSYTDDYDYNVIKELNSDETIRVINSVGFKNLTAINNSLKISQIHKPTIVRRSDNNEAIILNDRSISTQSLILVKPKINIYDIYNNLSSKEKYNVHMKHKGKHAIMNNFELIVNYLRNEIISDADILYCITNKGVLTLKNCSNSDNKCIYINGIKISNKIENANAKLNKLKSIGIKMKLLDSDATKFLIKELNIIENDEDQSSKINLFGTEYDIVTQYYRTKTQDRARIALYKNNKYSKTLYTTYVYKSYYNRRNNINDYIPTIEDIKLNDDGMCIKYLDIYYTISIRLA